MADEADRASDQIEQALEAAIENARADILPGKEGECDECGDYSTRLINGMCAPCRDLEDERRKRRMGQ